MIIIYFIYECGCISEKNSNLKSCSKHNKGVALEVEGNANLKDLTSDRAMSRAIQLKVNRELIKRDIEDLTGQEYRAIVKNTYQTLINFLQDIDFEIIINEEID